MTDKTRYALNHISYGSLSAEAISGAKFQVRGGKKFYIYIGQITPLQ